MLLIGFASQIYNEEESRQPHQDARGELPQDRPSLHVRYSGRQGAGPDRQSALHAFKDGRQSTPLSAMVLQEGSVPQQVYHSTGSAT